MEEHNPEDKFSYKTVVTQHLLDNPEHTINFEHPEVLALNLKELLIEETILIQQHRPDINVVDSFLPLYGFNNGFLLLIALLYFLYSGLLILQICQIF